MDVSAKSSYLYKFVLTTQVALQWPWDLIKVSFIGANWRNMEPDWQFLFLEVILYVLLYILYNGRVSVLFFYGCVFCFMPHDLLWNCNQS